MPQNQQRKNPQHRESNPRPHRTSRGLKVSRILDARNPAQKNPSPNRPRNSNVDPRLVAINSSAAECGNSSLKKIRKSVSYMSQRRAIVYTKIFLSIWNRVRLRKALGIKLV
ncbi:hypothetical protein CC1G_14020 [Coprinopsis cinerea okayama7|uniref:Uncharacterized protein n=1 Tax=Coprinopsis cinerea (strain Okayama-7 / 130 / ATCC MYA-4618 / FGSC 9003) TaxID=240176 RepID=D6RL10_COPC7|nr:hypothetical protein CC1G_14020 [Coprinopsis cinerea okayama7\|eukprot:XP_002911982.1 hypothetical protein CC1G_14020 [Coprinopsis cinerea okayama7\